MMSLRKLLVLSLSSVILLTSMVSAAFSYRQARIEAKELFDAKLAHSTRILMGLMDDALAGDGKGAQPTPVLINIWKASGIGGDDRPPSASGNAYETRLAFQVWDSRQRLRLKSDSGPSAALANLRPGFDTREIDGERWRSFTLQSRHGLWFQAGELNANRTGVATKIAVVTLAPLLLQWPLVMVLVWLIVTRACRTLERVTCEVERRAADALTPITIAGTPPEIAGAVSAVNHLMLRLDQALTHERRFTADAAHELRTPLAALKVHADNLQTAVSRQHQRESVDFVQQGIDRLGRLIEQLLAMSHLDPAASPAVARPVDLGALTSQVLAELALTSLGRRVDIAYQPPTSTATIQGDEVLLGLLIRNLIDNALRYTPRGGHVQIGVQCLQSGCELRIEDSGPGIEAAARERVFERFHRELGSQQEGSGLGLAIVRQVAELHGAEISLDQSPQWGGLRVSVRFVKR